MVPQETWLQGQTLEATQAPWLVAAKMPAPAPQGSDHRGRAWSGAGDRTYRLPVSPHPGTGNMLRTARLSGIRAGPSLHNGWDDGAFLSGSRCLAAARGCQPHELAWEEVFVGVVITRAGLRLAWSPPLPFRLTRDTHRGVESPEGFPGSL